MQHGMLSETIADPAQDIRVARRLDRSFLLFTPYPG
jgi:hypothetical protein